MRKTALRKIIFALLTIVIIGSGVLLMSSRNQDFKIAKSLDIYFTLFKELNLFYVDETDPEKLVEESINSMLESLDPYTTYISEKEMDDFKFMTTGKYGGIGAVIRKKDDYTMVVEPYEGSPAHKAGIMAGDIIKKIDNTSLKGIDIEEVSNLLKGTPNTKVKLLVERPYQEKRIDFDLIRKEISVPGVPYSGMLEDDIAYIRLTSFKEDCSEEIKKAYLELKKNKPKGLVLDLRSNPGGLLMEAIKIVSLFVDKNELVVDTRGKIKEFDAKYFTNSEAIDTEIPMVVLVNRGSASASEIVAGALQDYDRAVILGQRTFGKGLVQSTRPLSYNSQLKVTTAKYYIPSGRCIQALDYTHRNEDGSVGHIPDSLISEYKTRNGRIVTDGGGILPDQEIVPDYLSKFSIILITQDLIFDFVTKYVASLNEIPDPLTFTISDTDYQEFIAYAKDIEFDYKTSSEEEFDKLVEIAKKEKYYEVAKNEFDALKTKLGRDKFKDFAIFKTEIMKLIQEEIISRYHLQKGVIVSSLKDDKLVNESILLLTNQQKVDSLLKGGYQSAQTKQ